MNLDRRTMLSAGAALTLLAALPARSASAAASASAGLPSDSVYQLPLMLTDQQGQSWPLASKRGRPLLVSMFYTSCEFVCPMLVEVLAATQARLSAVEREKVSVLLVTFDPDRDSVAVLQRTAQQRELDPRHWTLARTDAKSVRKLAALLGIQYKAMPNGDFNHSTTLVLLDAEGRIAGRSSRLGDTDPAFVERVRTQAQRAA